MARANILSRGLAKINPSIYKNGIPVIMIQQVRINFTGMIAKTNGRSGGNAGKFIQNVQKVASGAKVRSMEKEIKSIL